MPTNNLGMKWNININESWSNSVEIRISAYYVAYRFNTAVSVKLFKRSFLATTSKGTKINLKAVLSQNPSQAIPCVLQPVVVVVQHCSHPASFHTRLVIKQSLIDITINGIKFCMFHLVSESRYDATVLIGLRVCRSQIIFSSYSMTW